MSAQIVLHELNNNNNNNDNNNNNKWLYEY